MHLENIDADKIVELEIATGKPIFFKHNKEGQILKFNKF